MGNYYLMKNYGVNKVLKVHKSLAYMEQSKYLEPKISYSFDELAGLLRSNNSCTESTHMSNITNLDKLTVRDFNVKTTPNTPSTTKKLKFSNKKSTNKAKLKSAEKDAFRLTSVPKANNTFNIGAEKHAFPRKQQLPRLAGNLGNSNNRRKISSVSSHQNYPYPKPTMRTKYNSNVPRLDLGAKYTSKYKGKLIFGAGPKFYASSKVSQHSHRSRTSTRKGKFKNKSTHLHKNMFERRVRPTQNKRFRLRG